MIQKKQYFLKKWNIQKKNLDKIKLLKTFFKASSLNVLSNQYFMLLNFPSDIFEYLFLALWLTTFG